MKLQIDELGFVGVNVEDWDINRSYRKPTITTDYNTWTTYITRKNVPAGILLTNDEYWKPILKGSGSLENIIRRLDELERKVAYYHPEGVTINVSPQTVYIGQSTQIEIVVSTTFQSDNIKLYRGNVEISHAEESTGFTYTDTVTPSTTDAIVYRVEAQIGGEIKRAEKVVTVEEAVVTDYYVGWTTGTKAQFAGKTDSEMINDATGFSSVVNPNYTHAFGSNNIFYLMYQANKAPRKVTLTSQGVPMDQDLINDNVCPHNDVNIYGATYKVFGIRMATSYDQADTMTVNF